MLNRKNFDLLFSLTNVQPWLGDKYNELVNLLFCDCKTQDEQDLLLELLNRVKFLNNDLFSKSIESMVQVLSSDSNLDPDETVITAPTMSRSPDSGQLIVYEMKSILQNTHWRKVKLLNRADRVIQEIPRRKNIIYVDEFIGTGKTIYNRVKHLFTALQSKGIDPNSINIKVCVVVSSLVGIEFLRDKGIDVHSEHTIKKGISDYCLEDRTYKIGLMKKLESILLEQIDHCELPSLGYGAVEALYYREHGNLPNSVFPIFWWPNYKDESERMTIMTRYLGDI